jgi:hypothetical protein
MEVGVAGSAIFFKGRRSRVKGRSRRGDGLWGRADAGRRRARGSGARARCQGGPVLGAVVEMPPRCRPAVHDADRGGERMRKWGRSWNRGLLVFV